MNGKESGMDNSQEMLDQSNEIAIIGMAGRFPHARNVDEFWRNLCNGEEAISFFSEEELELPTASKELIHDLSYVKAGVVLEEIEYFDAAFFGYNPREAEIMDHNTVSFWNVPGKPLRTRVTIQIGRSAVLVSAQAQR